MKNRLPIYSTVASGIFAIVAVIFTMRSFAASFYFNNSVPNLYNDLLWIAFFGSGLLVMISLFSFSGFAIFKPITKGIIGISLVATVAVIAFEPNYADLFATNYPIPIYRGDSNVQQLTWEQTEHLINRDNWDFLLVNQEGSANGADLKEDFEQFGMENYILLYAYQVPELSPEILADYSLPAVFVVRNGQIIQLDANNITREMEEHLPKILAEE